MQPKIVNASARRLTGMHMTMSFADNRTGALWQRFMPRRKEICGQTGTALFSLEVHDDPLLFFSQFDATRTFEKWAAVEADGSGQLPEGMENLLIPAGLYAVFIYKGLPHEAHKLFHYIFNNWLPSSGYLFDVRPHFAMMGEKYKNNDPDSEEEIWIPVKPV